MSDLNSLPAKVWINVYRPAIGACGSVYASRELADQMAGRDRLACIEVSVEENAIVPPGRDHEGFHP